MNAQVTSLPITDNDEGMAEEQFQMEDEALAAFGGVPSTVEQNAAAFVESTAILGDLQGE